MITPEDLSLIEWAVARLESREMLQPTAGPPPDARHQVPHVEHGLERLRDLVRELRMADAHAYLTSVPR